jgi:tetratricopeptide (TPR) repeat protein
MEKAAGGSGQLVAITAQAGIGKSRLLAEVLREANERGFAVHVGEAQSFGRTTTYLAWHGVWRSLLGFEPKGTAGEREAALGAALGKIDPSLLPRLPLLGAAVGLAIDDNELTRQFEAKLRKDSLEALLTSCLRGRAAEGPLVIAIEDAHWMDALSIELLESIGRAAAGMRVVLVVTSRTDEGEARATERMAPLPHFVETRLRELGRVDAGAIIERLTRARTGTEAAVPAKFVELVHARAEGNPFLAEELVGYLFDRGITPERATSGEAIELPSNVAGAILGRIDRLTPTEQTLVKVASVIGRGFQLEWLWGVYPELGTSERVRGDVEELERREIVGGDGGGIYTFKHSLIQEVVYESLPFEMRERLHEALAGWLEARGDGAVDLLAFHYGRTGNVGKKREYLRKAGDAAAARYANEAAAGYYEKLVEVVDGGDEKAEALLSLGMAKAAVSKWEDAEKRYDLALAQAGTTSSELRGRVCVALAETHTQRAKYDEARLRLEEARSAFASAGDRGGETTVLIEEANLFRLQGKFEPATAALLESLRIEGADGDKRRIARAYHVLGNTSMETMDAVSAQKWWSLSLSLKRELGDTPGVALLTTNTAVAAWAERRHGDARPLLEEVLALYDALGMRWSVGRATVLLGLTITAEGDFAGARALYRRALVILRDVGAVRELAELMVSMLGIWPAEVAHDGCRYVLRVAAAGFREFERLGVPVSPIVLADRDRSLPEIRARIGGDAVDEAWAEGRAMQWPAAVEYALGGASEPAPVRT